MDSFRLRVAVAPFFLKIDKKSFYFTLISLFLYLQHCITLLEIKLVFHCFIISKKGDIVGNKGDILENQGDIVETIVTPPALLYATPPLNPGTNQK